MVGLSHRAERAKPCSTGPWGLQHHSRAGHPAWCGSSNPCRAAAPGIRPPHMATLPPLALLSGPGGSGAVGAVALVAAACAWKVRRWGWVGARPHTVPGGHVGTWQPPVGGG